MKRALFLIILAGCTGAPKKPPVAPRWIPVDEWCAAHTERDSDAYWQCVTGSCEEY